MRDNLDALFTHAKEGIIISKKSGEIEMINPEAENQFGYLKSELIGRNISSLFFSGESGRRTAIKLNGSAHHDGANKGRERVGRKKDGSEFPVEITTSNYLLVDAEFEVAFTINISERKKQEEEIRHSHEELKQYSKILKETNEELENFAYIS